MKSQILPVKRRPVSKGLFHRLSAVTYGRKQRVAASPSVSEIDDDDGDSKISRALTIIFLIHIVAIALIFIHQKFLAGRTSIFSLASAVQVQDSDHDRKPFDARLSSGEKPYVVLAGDDYASIAAAQGVSEQALRQRYHDAVLKPGTILRLPNETSVTQAAGPVAVRVQPAAMNSEQGLVEAIPMDVSNAPRAQMVAAPDASQGTGTSYTVKAGDSIFRIASVHRVSQQSLMQANGITDPRKLRAGMKLVIPAN